MFLATLLSLLFLGPQPLQATKTNLDTIRQEISEGAKAVKTDIPVDEKDEISVTRHSINIAGKNLNYTVSTGFMPIFDAEGKIEAKMFFMAYTLDNAPKNRPLMFSFNGGPGSSSVWLHLGALGPKRVKMKSNGFMPPPPYELIDNPDTWLTDTDLVFIDPIGTGYSRAVDAKNKRFFSVDGDINSVGEFIRMYLSRNERWKSPLYLVGESYGTTRAAGLSGYLINRGIAFNGIALVSSVLSFQTILFGETNDLPLLLIFPSYTSTAWYHKRLSSDLQSRPLAEVLRLSEAFVTDKLGPSLMKIDRLSSTERSSLIKDFARFTGLSEEFVSNNEFRVELSEFQKELLRSQRKVVGRLDSRFTGIDSNVASDSTGYDPSMTAIRPPYTAMLNDYIRRELGFKTDLEYFILGGGTGRWEWNRDNSFAETSTSLRSAMQRNPFMKIYIASGYFDLATPYFGTEYTISNLNLDPDLRKNISFEYYEAGHMMYIEEASLKKLKTGISTFIKTSLN